MSASSVILGFQPVLLWTDALLFLLVALALLAGRRARAQAPLRAAWRKVGRRPTGMAAATVLLAFLVVGLVDSLHYRPLLPALEQFDRDGLAPFATPPSADWILAARGNTQSLWGNPVILRA